MLSLFYKTDETRTLDGASITIFSSSHSITTNLSEDSFVKSTKTTTPREQKETVEILVKGKLGQYKILWPYTKNLNSNTEGKKMLLLYDDKKNEFFKFYENGRHFLYNKQMKTIKDQPFLCSSENASTVTEKKSIFGHFYTLGAKQLARSQRLLIGTLPSGKEASRQKNSKSFYDEDHDIQRAFQQLKSIMIGVTQGYTMNLELRGIGYQAEVVKGIDSKNSSEKAKSVGKNVDFLHRWTPFGTLGRMTAALISRKGSSRRNSDVLMNIQSKFHPKRSGSATTFYNHDQWKQLGPEGALRLNLGWSHWITHPIPDSDIKVSFFSQTAKTVSIFGISYPKVNQMAALVYRYRPPEPYKGKGVRYDGEKFWAKQNTRQK